MPLPRGVRHGVPYHSLFRLRKVTSPKSCPRPFTQNAQLRQVSHPGLRPQLPFLCPTTGLRQTFRIPGHVLQRQLGRFLSTETKRALKYQAIVGVKYAVLLALLQVTIWSTYEGLKIISADSQFPSPAEWSIMTKFLWHAAKKAEESAAELGFVDRASVAQGYKEVLERLEDPKIDGAGLRPILADEGDIYVEGVGRTGLNVSEKSEEWRRCYFDCLMGAAKAAERLEGWVLDTKRGLAFPADAVIGQSNPHPRMLEKEAPAAPREEDVKQYETPTKFYMKILTTHGFTSRQRLEAALAYAAWLDFKGLTSTAEDMYDWGLDIAMGSLPHGVSESIDIKTGIISNNAKHISSNMLTASTALASHHARKGDLTTALPIFLSVLRARRQLPTANRAVPVDTIEQGGLNKFLQSAKYFIIGRPMPPAPPTGDDVPERKASLLCEEAGVMANIGELLFAAASSKPSQTASEDAGMLAFGSDDIKNREAGLAWTREAVDTAQTIMELTNKDDFETQTRCSECLRSGMDNWATMVATMLKHERAANTAAQNRAKKSWSWGRRDVPERHEWENEASIVAKRSQSIEKLLQDVKEQEYAKPFIFSMLGI